MIHIEIIISLKPDSKGGLEPPIGVLQTPALPTWLLGVVFWVNGGDRTHGHQNHNLALYQLSYVHHRYLFLIDLHHFKSQLKRYKTIENYVASEGFEPSPTDPKSAMLPLHHEA